MQVGRFGCYLLVLTSIHIYAFLFDSTGFTDILRDSSRITENPKKSAYIISHLAVYGSTGDYAALSEMGKGLGSLKRKHARSLSEACPHAGNERQKEARTGQSAKKAHSVPL